ncbi:MAG TPA: hypothetical protein VK060_16920 [Ruania sp.]|nr:hypothetical protein [Ruania sp.]
MLPFSPGPVPTTDDELTDRLTSGLLTLLRPEDPARVQVSCTGAAAEHLGTMHIDLSGADLDPVAAEVPAAGGTPVTVDRLSLTADPVTVRGVRLRVRGELPELPAAWTTDGAGILWLRPQEHTPVAGSPGQVQVTAEVADLEQAILDIGSPLLAERGLTLTSVRLQVDADGSAVARVQVQAQVRRGILSATVDGRGTASVDESMVLTLSDLTVTSDNALMSMGLAVLGRRLQAWEGRQIHLGTHLVGALAVREVSVHSTAGEVSVAARVGQ